MKIAVYTIALNEEQFVERWASSAADADVLLIADTGSTDRTVELARQYGIEIIAVRVRPWRFDDARNAALAALPLDIDYCIALDMDEVLLPDWRAELEKAHAEGWTRPRYQYTWNWNDDGSPGLTYGGDKIHARIGYRWKHPVHEVLRTYGDTIETQGWVGLEIYHFADNTKSRGQYMPLLKQAVDEDPADDRNAFYYARELYYYGRYDEAVQQFMRHLSLPRAAWAPERAASMRFIAKCRPEEAEYWLKAAAKEAPGRREPYVDLAKHYYAKGDWANCLSASESALAITERPLEYLCESYSWGAAPWDFAAISAYRMSMFKKALEYGEKAVELEPANERIAKNLEFYREARGEVG